MARKHRPSARRAEQRRSQPESRWTGASDWADADSEPLEVFESPRPHESVPWVVRPSVWEPPGYGRPLVDLANLPYSVSTPASRPPEPRRNAPSRSVTVVSTPRRPTTYQRNVGVFRPVLGGKQRTICDSRSDRRSALFASGRAGAGVRHGPGKYIRNAFSNYGCK